jgi:hypothetical protein
LVDWESALLAPPERDLWALAESDPGLLDAYTAATATHRHRRLGAVPHVVRPGRDLPVPPLVPQQPRRYGRCRRGWQNLQYFLRPAQRWPDLPARPA